MSHYNYHRRASIDKFNNRPPFNIKKMDDATSTEHKEQNTSFCNNCEKMYVNTAAKSYINVARYLEQFGDKYHQYCINNKNRKVIPKIIESFQKAAPKRIHNKTKSKKKSESLETLFRSDRQIFGNILPNHKLMKDLLKNFDENMINKYLPYQQFDMIPSKDTSTNISGSVIENNLTIRVDKGTSTTGLQWSVTQNGVENCGRNSAHPKYPVANTSFGKRKSKIPQRRELCTHNFCGFTNPQIRANIEAKRSSCSSDLEYFPTKENSLKAINPATKIPLEITKMTNNLNKMAMDKEFPLYKHNMNQENFSQEGSYVMYTDKLQMRKNDSKIEIRKKEKSFVKLQVEKFNRKNGTTRIRPTGPPSNTNLKAVNFQNKKKKMNKHYMSLINSVRDSLPKMENRSPTDSGSHEWSDNHVNLDHQVRFPKETRNAMEHLMNDFRRVPLARYVKNQDLDIQPAIPVTSHVDYREYNIKQAGMCPKRLSSACTRNSYQRNCQNGNKPETIHPPRCANKLRIKQKCPKIIASLQ